MQGCTNFKLRQLGRVVTQDYDAELSLTGLRITQYSLLSHVLKLGPIRSVDLAAAMNMDASTLSRNLKPLLSLGLIEVQKISGARSHSLIITPLGKDKRQEARKHWRIAQERLNKKLGEKRVESLHQLLDHALALLSKTPHSAP
jgi:DNA-binding MarR family transcriptional regulator